ncbi:MAG: hypothetical protein WDN46_19215 [Methylocella sp.]
MTIKEAEARVVASDAEIARGSNDWVRYRQLSSKSQLATMRLGQAAAITADVLRAKRFPALSQGSPCYLRGLPPEK